MSYQYRRYEMRPRLMLPPLPPAVKAILILTTLVFLWQQVLFVFGGFGRWQTFNILFGASPRTVFKELMIWQLVTYIFLHGGFIHFLFNMLIFYFFAPRLETTWGAKGFLKFFFTVGIGAGLFHVFISLLLGQLETTIIGASGAIFGILLAYALYWPNDIVYVYFILPMRVKTLVIILGGIELLATVSGAETKIAHLTHLGGLLIAFLYLQGGPLYRRVRYGKPRYYRMDEPRRPFDDLKRW